MSEWQDVRLGDVADILVGYAFKSSHFTTDRDDVRLLRGANIHQGFTDWGQEARWPRAQSYEVRYELAEGDVVLAMDRPWIERGLKRARLRAHDLPALLVQRVARLRGTALASTSFIHHTLATEQFSRFLQSQVTGATVPHISQSQIASYPMQLPQREVQAQICAVLDSMDDLIENNRRRVEVLEEMARAIYHEWFVKFRYPGHENVPLVDSALGPIPQGWSVQQLSSIANVNASSRKPTADEVIRYLDISALAERTISELDSVAGAKAPGRARRVLAAGDTVWATVRPNRRAHALVVEPGDDWIASTGLAVLTARTVSPAFLFETTSTAAFSDWLVGRATGAAYPAVRAIDFEEAVVLVPDPSTGVAFDQNVAPMHELGWKLRGESSELARLRDLLLPKLVTGQIDVSTLDLDALIEEQVAS